MFLITSTSLWAGRLLLKDEPNTYMPIADEIIGLGIIYIYVSIGSFLVAGLSSPLYFLFRRTKFETAGFCCFVIGLIFAVIFSIFTGFATFPIPFVIAFCLGWPFGLIFWRLYSGKWRGSIDFKDNHSAANNASTSINSRSK